MLRKIAAGAGGVGAAGFGTYYALQAKEVSKLDKEQRDIEKLVDTEKKRAANSSKGIADAEQAVAKLRQLNDKEQQGVEEAKSTLEAARRQVVQAEAVLKDKQDDASKVASELASTIAKINQLRSEAERAREAATLGEKSLSIARQQVQDARHLLNPLNHPKVKSLLGGGSSDGGRK